MFVAVDVASVVAYGNPLGWANIYRGKGNAPIGALSRRHVEVGKCDFCFRTIEA